MVCFYQDFDENSLKIWKRIESGEHFTEENCKDLITILKNKWRPKKVSDDNEPKAKRIKQHQHSDATNNLMPSRSSTKELMQSRSSTKVKVSDDGLQKFIQEFLSSLPRTELHSPKLRLDKVNNQQSSTDSKVTNASKNDETKENLELDDDLSISELNILIDNFESLTTKDQNHLILFLRNLEVENPEKFKTLH